MRRQDKYPETPTFHYHNQNPRNRITGDCLIRAISNAAEIPYNEVVMRLAKLSCETGYSYGDKKVYGKFLEDEGFVRMSQPRKSDNTKYTGSEFCKQIATKSSRYVVSIGTHHVTAVVDGKVNDIWNCTDDAVGVYWEKVHYSVGDIVTHRDRSDSN